MKKLLISFLLNAMLNQEQVHANVENNLIFVKIKSYNDNGEFYVSYHVDGVEKKRTTYLTVNNFITFDNVSNLLSKAIIKKINKQGIIKHVTNDTDIIIFNVTENAKGKLLKYSNPIQLNFEIDQETKQINGKLKLFSAESAIEIISIKGKNYNKFVKSVLKVLEHANSINAENMVVSAKHFLKSN